MRNMTTTTIGLQFTDARDEEKLFATAFTRDDALDCAAIVEKALPEIANLGAHDTRFLRGVPGSIVQLEGIVAVHPDLVMYCVMMKLELNVYRQNA